MLGILLVRKPPGLTSHDVVNDIRRRFHTRRVGHAGTLDPLATGLLVVAVGPATRFLQYLPLEPKVYEGVVRFGYSTNTYDAEGDPSPSRPLPEDLPAAITEALPAFTGLIQQLPPMFSAVKVNGKPLYKYARGGQEAPRREPRTVHISEFTPLSFDGAEVTFRIVCSGGTYIRSLANDLGEAIGCGAYLSGLVRTGVGRFSLDQAVDLAEARPSDLMPLHEALPPMPLLQLDSGQTQHVREGRTIGMGEPPDNFLVGLLEPGGTVFSVARVQGNLLQPECVIPAEVLDEAV
ncbi:tRNA pseudouridine(55) synthase TruB [Fimbriimonas ginsengisoli]|uniref:tRNA pseudouridine synthase B n=1 Tax=Fimbriimonas ginsengisoli Gsoil 348 TaxID=661478 RepID=A0A068NV50_FIMGI|nr:tRNA pseudouridine(55) synthase TruB [Fimbriimonas ginsengisoli]AIE87413.1 tRNA pseudouridine synthase B [Fimbriimonas ginsengisoli Gsoil 348]